MSSILLRGARQNNLRGIDLDIPHGALTVITGLSGSGKSSLALDTLFAEGQRRFVESLSTYSRQFLRRLPRPDVDRLEGIPPAVAIERKTPAASSRSTVATASEIHDYLRLLYARVGRGSCLKCGGKLSRDSVAGITERALARAPGSMVLVLFPVEIPPGPRGRQRRGDLLARGFSRLLLDGRIHELDGEVRGSPPAGRGWVVVDRIQVDPAREEVSGRLADSLETAFREGEGTAALGDAGGAAESFRLELSCTECGSPAPEARPHLFSFNSPYGACPRCRGFGDLLDFDPALIVPDPGLTLAEGALDPWRRKAYRFFHRRLMAFCAQQGIPLDRPFRELDPAWRQMLFEGQGTFRGVLPFLRRLYRKRYRTHIRFFLRRYMSYGRCPDCGGARLRPEALAFRVGGLHLGELVAMTVSRARAFLDGLRLAGAEEEIAGRILEELRRRLGILDDLGLGYLTLDRLSRTLSGGEAQRIGLAAALGSGLTGTLYVLDEPTVGLHVQDSARLLDVLQRLKQLGNTVVVVEHDRQIVEAADYVVDLGPGAGRDGGHVVFAGPAAEFRRSPTLTASYLRREREVREAPARRREPSDWIVVRGAREHNLRGMDVALPLGVLLGVTGVSGSGKTTLTRDIVFRALRAGMESELPPGAHDALEGRERAGEAMLIDQSPIGTSPRSNPATYVGAMAPIRDAFAATREAVMRGLKSGFFSFNVPGGRCEKCRGEGWIRVEMQFLADVFVPCDECRGKRFRPDALEITLGGKSIHDVLSLTVEEAVGHFSRHPAVLKRLEVLTRVGLGYLALGQPAPTLSGGEAQRLKIARELDLARETPAWYLLDEPTTGLHFHDVRVLLDVLDQLVARGHTVVVVEHHPDVIAACDYLVDLGPGGGEAGGAVVAAGTPEEVARVARSATGRMLRRSRAGRGSGKTRARASLAVGAGSDAGGSRKALVS